MIIIQFNDEKGKKTVAEKLEKPQFSKGLSDILRNWYSEDYAEQYAEELESFIHESMDYPDEGIYYVDKETSVMYHYDEKKGKWINTKETTRDYIINRESPIWKIFEDNFSYLKRQNDEIQSYVAQITSSMFILHNEKPINAIELTSYKLLFSDNDLLLEEVIKDYISEKQATTYIQELMKHFFGTEKSLVFLLKNGVTHAGLTEGDVLDISKKKLKNIKKFLSESFNEDDTIIISARIRNILFYGVDLIHEVIRLSQRGKPIVNVDGVELVAISDDEFMFELTDSIIEEIFEKSGFRKMVACYDATYFVEYNSTKNLNITLSNGTTIVTSMFRHPTGFGGPPRIELYVNGDVFADSKRSDIVQRPGYLWPVLFFN